MIGITGGIGSGKSTIAKALAQRGFTVYDCDEEAKRIVDENPDVQQEIIELLGEEAFLKKGPGLIYNTTYVAKRVFADETLLAKLNTIIHPAVGLDIMQRKPDFVESAILYESGLDILCDKIIVVDAPIEVRIARTIARDYTGKATPENIAKVHARMQAQQTHQGDLTIYNDGQTPVLQLAEEIIKFTEK